MSFIKTYFPYFCMILCQFAYSVMNILMKIAIQQGLSYQVFVAYRNLLALAISAPAACVLERKQRPPLSLLILVKIFFLALVGITMQQNIYFAGLGYTSPTVAGAFSSVIPAFTFILAVPLRMEKVRIRTAKGRTKVLGTLVSVSGALVFTFWKGHLLKGFVKRPLIVISGRNIDNGIVEVKENWVKGSLLILISQIMFSSWIVFQGVIFEAYPARLSLNALMCFFTSLQSSVEALIFERNKSSWQLGWNIQLAAVFYTVKLFTRIFLFFLLTSRGSKPFEDHCYLGIVISFVVYNLQIYCISEKGPLFSAIFYPLILVIVGIFSAIFYAERLHLGSLIGAIIIIIGLYSVLWGKTQNEVDEEKKKEQNYADREIQTTTQNPTSCNGDNLV